MSIDMSGFDEAERWLEEFFIEFRADMYIAANNTQAMLARKELDARFDDLIANAKVRLARTYLRQRCCE